MLADFRWTCANYVYMHDDLFSANAFETFKEERIRRNIRLEKEVNLDLKPTSSDISKHAATFVNSKCQAIVIITQTEPAAQLVSELYKQGYEGYILIQGASMSIASYVRGWQDAATVNKIMKGVIAVDTYAGVGTPRLVLTGVLARERHKITKIACLHQV